MVAHEQFDQSLQFSSKADRSGSEVFAQEHSDQGLQCLFKSILIRVYSVCSRVVK